MSFERLRKPSTSQQDESALKPATCPECGSKKFGTLAPVITSDTYWRCHDCGTVWNEIRYRQQRRQQW
jgi:uncharacterized Zn finger protein